jgi:antitoxin component YwqK of YwqJK toxin-antitoxin module
LEVHWKDGEKDGLETWWDEDGRKIIEVQYKGGEEVSHKEF